MNRAGAEVLYSAISELAGLKEQQNQAGELMQEQTENQAGELMQEQTENQAGELTQEQMRSEEHTSELSHVRTSRMPSSA